MRVVGSTKTKVGLRLVTCDRCGRVLEYKKGDVVCIPGQYDGSGGQESECWSADQYYVNCPNSKCQRSVTVPPWR